MDALTALLGGINVEVTDIAGAKELVLVRQLPIRDLPAYERVIDDERATAALFVDRPAEWVDRLTRESFEAVIEAGERLNLDFLARRAARRVARHNKLMPDLITQAVESVMGSPAKPLPANAPASQSGPG